MPKQRPNPASRRPTPRKRDRPRRVKRSPPAVKVFRIHCKACKRRYELTWTGEVNFCSFCASDQIEKVIATRGESRAEREQRSREMNARFIDAASRMLFGVLGISVPTMQRPESSPLEAELLKEGYRKLAAKYHPDHGGDPEKMKELNRLKEKLGL